MGVTVVGVYPVEDADEPCHMIELDVDSQDPFDVGQVTQEDSTLPRDEWQVPYDEHAVDTEGRDGGEWSSHRRGRVVFFFHYLRLDRPLLTPVGAVELPQPQKRPSRLESIQYESPC
jgi:hypothetical protein